MPRLTPGSIPINITFQLLKCIWKITIKNEDRILCSTGFFMRVLGSLKYLITCYHTINKNDITNKKISIKFGIKKDWIWHLIVLLNFLNFL